MEEGSLLWTPSEERLRDSNVVRFIRHVEERTGLQLEKYDDLWRWSVEHLEEFWASVWDFADVRTSNPYSEVLRDGQRSLPGADWFPDARLNYAEHLLRHEHRDGSAILYASEEQALQGLSWSELGRQVRAVGRELRRLGVRPGDRVVGYLTNVPEAIIAMIATTSIGAIWSVVASDFGWQGVLDRFQQLEPKVVFFVSGYRFGGEYKDRAVQVSRIIDGLPTLVAGVEVGSRERQVGAPEGVSVATFSEMVAAGDLETSEYSFEQVPFSHPLWVLFSSGTTGPPKAIVHSHGGVLVEHLKYEMFHLDLRAGDRAFWYTSTTWMVWNFLASMLALGVTPVLYDGDPKYPAASRFWKLAEEADIAFLGTSPGFIELSQRSGIVPGRDFDLSSLRTVLPAGSPVGPEHGAWLYEAVKSDLWLATATGGTDVCSGFVGGVPILPVYAGEMQGRCLGVSVYAFNSEGEPIVDEVGELVVCDPIPSMPLGFWNDPQDARYLETYFSHFPGCWRHGDLFRINERGGCFVLGRSDATLNRRGVRIGTAEIYRALESITDIEDSLVVHLDDKNGSSFMPLFVELGQGKQLTADLEAEIRGTLEERYSRRHVPDAIVQVRAVPRTLTEKRMEVPVRRILQGDAVEEAVNINAMSNPESLDEFVEFAGTQMWTRPA